MAIGEGAGATGTDMGGTVTGAAVGTEATGAFVGGATGGPNEMTSIPLI